MLALSQGVRLVVNDVGAVVERVARASVLFYNGVDLESLRGFVLLASVF